MHSPDRPRIAIIIAAESDPVLLSEAIHSALAQDTEHGFVVLGVHGSSAPDEVRDVLAGWRALRPERLHALSLAARGSVAIGKGALRYVLGAFPAVEAIFSLRPEDRLEPTVIDCFAAVLDRAPEIGWFRPTFYNFGFDGPSLASDNGGCVIGQRIDCLQAGVLVRRWLLEAAFREDESDRGRHNDADPCRVLPRSEVPGAVVEAPVLGRRRRAKELANDRTGHEADRLDDLGSTNGPPQRLAAGTGRLPAPTPSFLVHFAETGQTRIFTDPEHAEDLAHGALDRRVYAALESSDFSTLPPVWIVADRQAWEFLSNCGLLRFALRDLHGRLAEENRASLSLLPDEAGRFRFLWDSGGIDESAGPLALLAVPLSLVRTALSAEYGPELIAALASEPPDAVTHRAITVPSPIDLGNSSDPTLAQALRAFFAGLLESRYASSLWLRGTEGSKIGEAGAKHLELNANLSDQAGVPYPIRKDPARPDVGFALPHCDFGGVEKVAAALALELRRAGFRTHLFLIGGNPITPSEFTAGAFDTLNWFAADGLLRFDGPPYLGARTSGWKPQLRERADLIALLSWLDVLINAQSSALHEIVADLRRAGVVTVAHEHVIERSVYGRPYGPPHSLLAYEPGYDLVAACSDGLSAWLHAQGVAREKLVPIANQPGYPMTPEARREIQRRRAMKVGERPLGVLFLGRFDRQKGIDRLAEIIAELEADAAFQFTVAGKALIDGESTPPEFPSSVRLLPPVYSSDALTQLYAAADVVLLPSRFEGLPLTILEAQRCGCVVIATDVGENGEAIAHGETGFLVPERSCVSATVRLLRHLSADRSVLEQVSASASQKHFDWSRSAADLIDRLRSLLEAPRTGQTDARETSRPDLPQFRANLVHSR